MLITNRNYNKIPKGKTVNQCNLLHIQPNLMLKSAANTVNSQTHSTLNDDNTSATGLKLAHLNIRSLRNIAHFLQLKEFTKINKIDVLTVSETWLNTTVTNKEVEIEGYKLHRLDRLHKKGGGICTYVRKGIKSTVIKDLTQISDTNFHQLWITLQYKKSKSLLVCTSYRPPDCSTDCFENFFKPSYIQALILGKPIIILGDLNCNMLKTTSPEFKALTELTSELNLKQIILSPTRITDTSQSLIDLILVSSPKLVRDSGVLNTSISDHLPVYVTLKLKSTKPLPSYITVRSYKNYNADLFAADLASKSDRLLSIFSVNDVNKKLQIFDEVLQTTLNAHAPVKTLKVRGRPCPFVTPQIKELMVARDQLHCIFMQTRHSRDWRNFKEAHNAVKITLVKAQREHVLDQVREHKSNTGSLWKIIKDTVAYKEKDSVVYSKNPKVVAEEFNHFFSTVGINAAMKATQLTQHNNLCPDMPPVTTFAEPEMFKFKPASCTDVKNIISSMPTNKAPGKDKVNMRIIKDCLQVILGPLTDIINASLTSSTFPQPWKEAEVIPLVKEG